VGESCPHCEKLDEYLNQNNLYEELDIQSYEIYNNEENLAFYLKKSQELDYTGGQVPLLIDGDKFYDGNTKIQAHLRQTTALAEEDQGEPDFEKLNEIIKEEASQKTSDKTNKIIGIIIILAGLGVYVNVLKRVKKHR